MNLCGFKFDSGTEAALNSLVNSGNLPHAMIIEGEPEVAAKIAALLSAYAVCEGEDKPCGICRQCVQALEKAHADVMRITPDRRNGRKTDTYSIDQTREIIADTAIKPNGARAKVYIFEECDRRLTEIVQNALLKTIEEPPKNVHFIFLCRSSRSLLPTVLSRCMLLKIRGAHTISDEAFEKASSIAKGIISTRGYDLMLALRALEDKKLQKDIIEALELLLRDALMIASGATPQGDSAAAVSLARSMTVRKLLDALALCGETREKLGANANIKLLTTWMCGEFRRISWQR